MTKIDAALNRLHNRLDQLEAQGVDITKLADPVKVAAQREKDRKNAKRRDAKHAASRAAAVAHAATFEIGQAVRTERRIGVDFLTGTVAAVDGVVVTLDIGRRFAASALVAA